jgi:hypothetical protein
MWHLILAAVINGNFLVAPLPGAFPSERDCLAYAQTVIVEGEHRGVRYSAACSQDS